MRKFTTISSNNLVFFFSFGKFLNCIKARFHYERGKKHSLFVLLIFFELASILTARFNRRSIKETKNVLFHARSGNGPLVCRGFRRKTNWSESKREKISDYNNYVMYRKRIFLKLKYPIL